MGFRKGHKNGIDFLQDVDLDVKASLTETKTRKNGRKGAAARGTTASGGMVTAFRSAMRRADDGLEGGQDDPQTSSQSNIVHMSGRSWGIEVCLDHKMGQLQKQLKSCPRAGP